MHSDTVLQSAYPQAAWLAELELGFERRGARTALAQRRHDGPLLVQKPLYPEGSSVCHAIVLHPPAGIAGGDELQLTVQAGAGAHALLTTPGAGKWYRSAGARARQCVRFAVASGAALEWLPQETIVFEGARAELCAEIRLGRDARYIGWEILCLGRTGSGERFAHGHCELNTALWLDERLLWLERGRIEGADPLLASGAGLAGHPVCGTLLAVGDITDELLAACRAVESERGAVTRLPGLLVGRYLGASAAQAKKYFTSLWRVLRPALLGCEGVEPRIWKT